MEKKKDAYFATAGSFCQPIPNFNEFPQAVFRLAIGEVCLQFDVYCVGVQMVKNL